MKYLTIAEAAEEARCSSATLRRAVHAGKLPAYKPGRDMLLFRSDFDAWVKAKQIMPAMDPRLIRGAHPSVVKLLRAAGA